MLAYAYHPENGALIGAFEAQLDKLESELQHEQVWMLPAFSTAVSPPPFGARQIPLFDADAKTWSIVPDRRGEIWIDAEGRLVKIFTVGDPADRGLAEPTASELLAPSIKAECGRRIFDVTKNDQTQSNIAAYVLGIITAQVAGSAPMAEEIADVAMAQAIKSWVIGMRAASRDLVAAADEGFAGDGKWPPAPAGARAFADRF